MGSDPSTGNTVAGVLVTHFWKLFAVVVLGLIAWAAYDNRNTWNSFRVTTSTSGEPPRQRKMSIYYLGFGALSDLSKEQAKPAVVVLKDRSGTVEGFFQSADEEFLMLTTVYKEKSETVTVLIPWENVLYISMTGKDRPDKK